MLRSYLLNKIAIHKFPSVWFSFHKKFNPEMGTEYVGDFDLDQGFYRNYEKDNTLALADYVGRTNAIQTPIELVERGADYVILRNIPVISELIAHPENFYLHNMTQYQQPEHTNASRKVVSITDLGTYLGNPNCVRFDLNAAFLLGNAGDRFALYNAFPKGMWRNPDIITPEYSGSWNNSYTPGSGAVWKNSLDNTYSLLVHGYNSSGVPRIKTHLFKANSLSGPWIDQNSATQDIFTEIYPVGYNGMWMIIGNINTSPGIFAGGTCLTVSNSPNTPAIVEWNEDLSYKKITPITYSYAWEFGGFNAPTFWHSFGYYKRKYLFVLHDGFYNSGKRIMLQSDSLYGPYTYHSTIITWSDWSKDVNGGCMFTTSIAHGIPLTMGNKLYYISSGEPGVNQAAGEFNNHNLRLWKYDDNTGLWDLHLGPIYSAIHAYYALFGMNHDLWDHCSYMSAFMIENDKLWFCSSNSKGTDTYTATNGYLDILQYLTKP